MTTLVACWKIKTASSQTVLDWMPDLASATRKEPGCLRYEYYQSPTEPSDVLLFEQYKDDEGVEAHRATPHFRSFVIERILPLLETRNVHVFHDK